MQLSGPRVCVAVAGLASMYMPLALFLRLFGSLSRPRAAETARSYVRAVRGICHVALTEFEQEFSRI